MVGEAEIGGVEGFSQRRWGIRGDGGCRACFLSHAIFIHTGLGASVYIGRGLLKLVH
jgi:hypothetical protein